MSYTRKNSALLTYLAVGAANAVVGYLLFGPPLLQHLRERDIKAHNERLYDFYQNAQSQYEQERFLRTYNPENTPLYQAPNR